MSSDYTSIIKHSFEIVKKNKWLLVYGLLLAGSGGAWGSSNLNIGDLSEIRKIFEEDQPDLPEKGAQVLGTFASTLGQWFTNVGLDKWLLLILGVLVFILFSVVLGLVIQSWAKASLITGVQIGLESGKTDLKNTSSAGITQLKKLIIFSLLMTAITFLILTILPLAWFLIFLVFKGIQELKIFWIIVGVFLGLTTFFIMTILFAMVSIYAERLIVLRSYTPWEAWKEALRISKKSFMSTLVMGIINSIAKASVGCLGVIILLLILGLPIFFLLYPGISKGQFPYYSIFPAAILFIIFIFANMVIRAALVVLIYSNWNQVFNEFISQKEAEEPIELQEKLRSSPTASGSEKSTTWRG